MLMMASDGCGGDGWMDVQDASWRATMNMYGMLMCMMVHDGASSQQRHT
jgi:hypothetical protein